MTLVSLTSTFFRRLTHVVTRVLIVILRRLLLFSLITIAVELLILIGRRPHVVRIAFDVRSSHRGARCDHEGSSAHATNAIRGVHTKGFYG